MPSSRAEQALAAIVADYEAALLALDHDELERVETLLDDVDRRLAELHGTPDAGRHAGEQALLARAQDRHRELCTRVATARGAIGPELDHVRAGRRALQGYAQGPRPSGERFDRDA